MQRIENENEANDCFSGTTTQKRDEKFLLEMIAISLTCKKTQQLSYSSAHLLFTTLM